MDPQKNVRALQAKVMWDIRFCFARRGGENIETMTKDTFKLATDPNTGRKYILKVQDEETKNHKEVDGHIITGFMPEMDEDHPLCPVTSYLTYIYSLSKENNNLWQAPRFTDFPEDPCEQVYYGPGNVGHNTHENFVSSIAKKCGLKDFKYTNHSLRVSAINILTRKNYSNKQIMANTGHKSSASLETYQHVSTQEKLQMGLSLGNCLVTNTALVPYVPPQDKENESKKKENQADGKFDKNPMQILPLEANIDDQNQDNMQLNMTDEELINLIQQTENDHQELMMSQKKEITTYDGQKKQVVSTNTMAKKNSPQIPMFQGCTIHRNFTININK